MDSNGSGPTPEKQLLKLIEQPQEADAPTEKPRGAGAGALSPSAIRGRFSFLCGRASGYLRARKGGIGLKGTSKLLGAGALVLVLFLGWDVTASLNELRAMTPLEPKRNLIIDVERELKPEMGREDYVKAFNGRDPFDFHAEKEPIVDDTPTAQELKERQFAALREGLVYVGYEKIKGELVATIQDTGIAIKHTVRSGDKINGLKIESVLREKVTVGFMGLTAELPLGGQK